jgi:hypothetical protein
VAGVVFSLKGLPPGPPDLLDLSIITLNVYGLNSPIKRHILAGWVNKKIRPDHL